MIYRASRKSTKLELVLVYLNSVKNFSVDLDEIVKRNDVTPSLYTGQCSSSFSWPEIYIYILIISRTSLINEHSYMNYIGHGLL